MRSQWSESEMDLVGRIMDATGLIADNPRVFDGSGNRFCVGSTCINVECRHFEQLSKSNSLIKFTSENEF